MEMESVLPDGKVRTIRTRIHEVVLSLSCRRRAA